MVKEDIEDFNEFHFSLLLTALHKLFTHMAFANSLWKSELAELFQILVVAGGNSLL